MELRKVVHVCETVYAEMNSPVVRPITRVAAAAVVRNPFAGTVQADLGALFELGGQLGEQLSDELRQRVPYEPTSYGKAAIVGVNGDFEHGGALIHPRLGKPMRAALGGGKALIPSNVKVGAPGCAIDVPLGHKDEAWSFDHFDTLTVAIGDAPRPNELVLIIAFADGGRANARCGDGPLVD